MIQNRTNNPYSNVKLRKYNLLIFVFVFFTFSFFVSLQKSEFSPEEKLSNLQKNGHIILIPKWNVAFEVCDFTYRQCFPADNEEYEIELPGAGEIIRITEEIKDATGHSVNKARITADLSFSTRAWMRSQKNPVNLVIPQFMGNLVINSKSPHRNMNTAYLHDIVFNIPYDNEGANEIELEVFFSAKTKWFGPTNITPALASWKKTRDYANLDQLKTMTSHISRLAEVILPLLIVSMALVIDHSVVLMFLGLFASSIAVRTIIVMFVEMTQINSVYPVLAFLYGVSSLLLIRFSLHLGGIDVARWKTFLCTLLSGLITLSIYYLDDSQQILVSMDLWVDFVAALVSALILGYSILRFSLSKKEVDEGGINRSRINRIATLSVATFFLLLSMSANLFDLVSLQLGGFKDYLNWAHYTLLPGLLFAVFLNIGSIVNTIKRVSAIVREKSKIDRDLEIGKQLQSGILPEKKSRGDGWAWHAFYYPAAHLAGDWFDLREVQFRCGKQVLLSAVVDITGHGISSAMLTSNIASHWSLWCNSLSGMDYPNSQRELDQVIMSAPLQIHRGLVGLRYNLGCSLAVICYEPDDRNLTYLTAGHPGIVVAAGSRFDYLTTVGTRPGINSARTSWGVSNKVLDDDVDQIILYTDGIVEYEKSVPVWLKHIRRNAMRSGRKITSYFTSQLRRNRRSFLKDPDKEDDLTLLIIKV